MDHIVRVGETSSSYRLEIFPGGKGLNQSIAIARAGAKVYHAGCIGSDGAMLTELLEESGVDISYIRTVDVKNAHAIIQVNAQGNNSIFYYGGSNEMISKEFVDFVLEHFGEDDILLIQNEISNVEYIIEKAYARKMCIAFNPSPIRENIKCIDFDMLSYLILNEVEATEISGCKIPEEALAFFKKRYPKLKIILTLGDKGSVYSDCHKKIRQSAFRIGVVDTTSAGSTFTGYFIAGISSGAEPSYALRVASAASALSVSRSGAAPSIPWKKEVIQAMNVLKEDQSNFKREFLRNQIDAYVSEHMKDGSLEGLAKTLNYSVIYTGSLVKNLTGQSFSDLLQTARCSAVAKLLLQTDISINEIIHSVGYENKSFFRTKFKEKYGKNPLEYRKNGG